MSSNFSSGLADWLQPGKKEARERAQIVQKRRMSAAALIHDLETALNDATFGVELDKNEYQPSDVAKLQAPLDRARQLLNTIYTDLTEINNRPLPEMVTEIEAYQLMQPVLRVESRVNEVRSELKKAAEIRDSLDLPRQTAKSNIEAAERKRLQNASALQDTRQIVRQMQEGRAENAPEVAAAFLTAEREITTANQLVQAAQLALTRKGWREANDLADRANRLFGSAQDKIESVKAAGQDFAHAAADAQVLLDRALQRLNEAKTQLTAKATLISGDPNLYLQKSVQYLGEARRALKQNPPQAMTAYRLATEGNSLIEEALAQADDEMRRLKNGRIEARAALQQLHEAILAARTQLSNQQVVPVASNDMYRQARREYDRLYDAKVDELKPDELEKIAGAAQAATRLAEQASKLLPSP